MEDYDHVANIISSIASLMPRFAVRLLHALRNFSEERLEGSQGAVHSVFGGQFTSQGHSGHLIGDLLLDKPEFLLHLRIRGCWLDLPKRWSFFGSRRLSTVGERGSWGFLRDFEQGIVIFLHDLEVLFDDGVDFAQLVHFHHVNTVLLFNFSHQSLLFVLILFDCLFEPIYFPLKSAYFLTMFVFLNVHISLQFKSELIQSHIFLLQLANLAFLIRHLQSHHILLIGSLFLLSLQSSLKDFPLFNQSCHSLCCLLAICSGTLKLSSQGLVLESEFLHLLQQFLYQCSILRRPAPIIPFAQYLLHNLNYKPPQNRPPNHSQRTYPKSTPKEVTTCSPN